MAKTGKRSPKKKTTKRTTATKRAPKSKKRAAAPKKRAAKNGGGVPPVASLPPTDGNEGGVAAGVVLFDAICETSGCPTPVLARAVKAFAAKQATNAHVHANPTHSVRVVAEA